jgi:hypothetical protein
MAGYINKELTEREWSKADEPEFDLMSLLMMAASALTGGLTIGGVMKSVMGGKLKEVAKVAVKNGESTQVDDTEEIKRKYGV